MIITFDIIVSNVCSVNINRMIISLRLLYYNPSYRFQHRSNSTAFASIYYQPYSHLHSCFPRSPGNTVVVVAVAVVVHVVEVVSVGRIR